MSGLTLPAGHSAAGALVRGFDVSAPNAAERTNTPKILVIDDDDLLRDTIAQVLGDHGYEVILAADGHLGVQLFQQENPALVITDIYMPGKDGLETIEEIRALRPNTKIIAISGGGRFISFDFLSVAAKFGACEILAKPFRATQLLASIERAAA